jgi:Spy/CpxP family protein refolding chaperone
MSDNRTRIWFSLFVLAIFGLGLATGLFMGRRMAPPARMVEGGPMMRGPMGGVSMPAQPPGMLLERLDRALRLSAEQRGQLEQIFKSRGDRLAEVQREVVARADEERREMQAEIRTILTPEQQERFDRWLEQPPRGPGRGGRGRGGPPLR